MKRFRFIFTALLIAGVIIFTSCEKDDENTNDLNMAVSIVDAASNTADLSILVSVLNKYPDLVSALGSESGTYTVFAPTNAAFERLLDVIGQTSADDIPEDVLKSVLMYHVLGTQVFSTDLSDGLSAETLNGENIEVSMSGMNYLINGAGINTADIMVDNGLVHLVNDVLVPPSVAQFVNTIVEPAYFNKSFTTLIAAVKAASPSILETLLGDGPSGNGMTLFAPTNEAFEAAGITALPDQATLDAVLAYHLIDGVVMSTDLPATEAAAPFTINAVGGDIYLSNQGSGAYLNGNSMISAVDIDPANGIGESNGIVHVIDQTLLPPSKNLVTIAIEAGFNKLAEALTEANLVTALQGDGPFTVFAPTDAAFDALYTALNVDGPSEIDDQLLNDVLLYHVAGLRAFSTDLEDGLAVPTLQGSTFTVGVDASVTITDGAGKSDTNVNGVNILGTNGVIHIIDQVIMPATK